MQRLRPSPIEEGTRAAVIYPSALPIIHILLVINHPLSHDQLIIDLYPDVRRVIIARKQMTLHHPEDFGI